MAFQFQPGIYRTTKYLPGAEAQVEPDRLVLIRTDGEFAPASVVLPVRNENNNWRFSMPGVKVPAASLDWGESLVKLPNEGFYRLTREKVSEGGARWVVNAIVQLGYNAKGEAIIFGCPRRKAKRLPSINSSGAGLPWNCCSRGL